MQSATNKNSLPSGVDLPTTGFGYTLSLIGGKYKILILTGEKAIGNRRVIFLKFKCS